MLVVLVLMVVFVAVFGMVKRVVIVAKTKNKHQKEKKPPRELTVDRGAVAIAAIAAIAVSTQ